MKNKIYHFIRTRPTSNIKTAYRGTIDNSMLHHICPIVKVCWHKHLTAENTSRDQATSYWHQTLRSNLIIYYSILLTLSVLDEGDSWNVHCALGGVLRSQITILHWLYAYLYKLDLVFSLALVEQSKIIFFFTSIEPRKYKKIKPNILEEIYISIDNEPI
jgi:hypothetical protein